MSRSAGYNNASMVVRVYVGLPFMIIQEKDLFTTINSQSVNRNGDDITMTATRDVRAIYCCVVQCAVLRVVRAIEGIYFIVHTAGKGRVNSHYVIISIYVYNILYSRRPSLRKCFHVGIVDCSVWITK